MSMLRVNYYADKFGFVGWECYSSKDNSIMLDCIKITQSQMGKMIGEQINFQVIQL